MHIVHGDNGCDMCSDRDDGAVKHKFVLCNDGI